MFVLICKLPFENGINVHIVFLREKPHQSPAIEHGRRSNVFVDKLNIKGSPVKINKK